jgi:hypothetical protein
MFEICGGSPAVECTITGIESCRQQEEQDTLQVHDPSNIMQNEEFQEENATKKDEGRRSLVKFLHDKGDSKLTKKVATDTQLTAIANEELIGAETEGSRENEGIGKKVPENYGFICRKLNGCNNSLMG